MKSPLVIISNLYPLPWQPTRATFNFQQFSLLAQEFDTYILIPVAFPDWFKHRKQITKEQTRIKIVPYFYLPKFGRRFYSTFMYYSLKLMAWRWLKKLQPKTILASWAYPDGVAAEKLAKKLQCQFYLKVHGSDINMHASFPERAKQIVQSANQANGILSVSQDLASKMIDLGVEPQRIEVIYNGVNLDKFSPKNHINTDTTPYILFIGNLKKEKGVVELLEAFKLIASEFPAFKLKYVGSGGMLSKLKTLAQQAKLESRIDFEGVKPHEQLPAILANAKLLALPSYNEGVPNVILEAMASGVPVVATRVGGIPEVLPKECGLLANSITAQAIAEQLTSALTQDWNTKIIRQHAEQFNWQRNINQLTALLTKK
jgi:glycosyltransferase involved in cell wall biosynthesis